MNKIEDRTQHKNSFEVEQIKNSKVKLTTHTKLRGVSPHQVYDFLVNQNNERYRLFHPKDHKEYKVLHRPKKGIVGTIVYLKEEYENGYITSAKAKFIEANPDKKIVLKSVSPWWQPSTLVFVLESIDNGTLITHHMLVGSALPIIGYAYNRIIKTGTNPVKTTISVFRFFS